MPRRLVKEVKGLLKTDTTVEGIMYNDYVAVSPCQKECNRRLGETIQLEQEAYLIEHPEVLAMLEIFVSRAVQDNKRKDILQYAGYHFTRPFAELDKEIRMHLKSPVYGPYLKEVRKSCGFEMSELHADLVKIILRHYPLKPYEPPSSEPVTPNTESSSFISLISSSTTLPTPEPVPTPQPTLSEIMYKVVVNTLDKATFSRVTEELLKYDVAYVELMKAVEEAMEIPVIDIRKDIVDLYETAYERFNAIIEEKERIAAEIAWERRMRKKLKRTLRRQNNFKGYETPPTSKSGEPSSHASYKIPPARPCKCHPQWTYNRYPKDRFGIYMPCDEVFNPTSITVTPVMSVTDLEEL